MNKLEILEIALKGLARRFKDSELPDIVKIVKEINSSPAAKKHKMDNLRETLQDKWDSLKDKLSFDDKQELSNVFTSNGVAPPFNPDGTFKIKSMEDFIGDIAITDVGGGVDVVDSIVDDDGGIIDFILDIFS